MGEMRIMSARASLQSLQDDELVEKLKTMGAEIKGGDTKIIWNPRDPDEVSAARKTWDRLVGRRGFRGFRVREDGGERGEQVREFDPELAKLVIIPPMAGG